MVNDLYGTVAQRTDCIQNESQYHHGGYLQILTTSRPLNFIAIDIFYQLTKVK